MELLKTQQIDDTVQSMQRDYTFYAVKLFSKLEEYKNSSEDLRDVLDEAWKKFFPPLYRFVSYSTLSFSVGTLAIYLYHYMTNTPTDFTLFNSLSIGGCVTSFIVLLISESKMKHLKDLVLKHNRVWGELKSVHRDADYLDQRLYNMVPAVHFQRNYEEEWNREILENNQDLNPVFKIWYIRMKLRKEFENRKENITVHDRHITEMFYSHFTISLLQTRFSDARVKWLLSFFGIMTWNYKWKTERNDIVSENIQEIYKMCLAENKFVYGEEN